MLRKKTRKKVFFSLLIPIIHFILKKCSAMLNLPQCYLLLVLITIFDECFEYLTHTFRLFDTSVRLDEGHLNDGKTHFVTYKFGFDHYGWYSE